MRTLKCRWHKPAGLTPLEHREGGGLGFFTPSKGLAETLVLSRLSERSLVSKWHWSRGFRYTPNSLITHQELDENGLL